MTGHRTDALTGHMTLFVIVHLSHRNSLLFFFNPGVRVMSVAKNTNLARGLRGRGTNGRNDDKDAVSIRRDRDREMER